MSMNCATDTTTALNSAPAISMAEGPLASLLGAAHDPLTFLRAAGLPHPLLGAAGRDCLDVVESIARAARAFREPSIAAPPRPGDLVILRSRAVYVVLGSGVWRAMLPGRVVIQDGSGASRGWRSGGGTVVLEERPLEGGGWSVPVRVDAVVDLEALIAARESWPAKPGGRTAA